MKSGSVSEWEQWALAHHYVKVHGNEAPTVVALRADQLLARGEVLGSHTYVAIKLKCEQLLAPVGQRLH